MTNDWVTFAGAEAYLGLSSATPGYPASLSGSVSLDMSGASSGGWGTTPYTEAQAYDVTKSSHFATATVCLDLAMQGLQFSYLLMLHARILFFTIQMVMFKS